jgi:membrane-associated phospholipid phosphatase
MPLTWLDTNIPHLAAAFWIYASLWVYTALPVALQPNFGQLAYYGVAIMTLCVAGLALFYFWPSVVPEAYQTLGGQRAEILQGLDAPGNACPSLHVASAVFSALWLRVQLKALGARDWIQWLNMTWCIAIVYSTLATRQHVFLDAVAGTILGGVWALFALWGMRGLARKYSSFARA